MSMTNSASAILSLSLRADRITATMAYHQSTKYSHHSGREHAFLHIAHARPPSWLLPWSRTAAAAAAVRKSDYKRDGAQQLFLNVGPHRNGCHCQTIVGFVWLHARVRWTVAVVRSARVCGVCVPLVTAPPHDDDVHDGRCDDSGSKFSSMHARVCARTMPIWGVGELVWNHS